MPEIVGHWGVHDAGGIWFLEQAEGSSNALGLSLSSPFAVRAERKAPCNHSIKLGAGQRPPDWVATDPLVQVMAPIPKQEGDGVSFILETKRTAVALVKLARMSTPITSIIRPIWSKRVGEWLPELEVTNVQPLVLTGVEPKHIQYLRSLVSAASLMPRRLVLTGKHIATPGLSPVIQDRDEYPDLAWDEVGAWMLGRWMRGEHAS